jgi:hypothetical protein
LSLLQGYFCSAVVCCSHSRSSGVLLCNKNFYSFLMIYMQCMFAKKIIYIQIIPIFFITKTWVQIITKLWNRKSLCSSFMKILTAQNFISSTK